MPSKKTPKIVKTAKKKVKSKRQKYRRIPGTWRQQECRNLEGCISFLNRHKGVLENNWRFVTLTEKKCVSSCSTIVREVFVVVYLSDKPLR